MKFLTLTGEIVTVKADQKQVPQCYAESLKVALYPPIRESAMPHLALVEGTKVMTSDKGSQIWSLTVYQPSLGNGFEIDPWDDTSDNGLKPIKELVQLQLGLKPGQCTQLSRDLTSHEQWCIADELRRNTNLFAWQPSDMTRIHPSIICHKFSICSQAKPLSQKKRKMGEEWCKAIKEEVDKLVKANFIREVRFST